MRGSKNARVDSGSGRPPPFRAAIRADNPVDEAPGPSAWRWTLRRPAQSVIACVGRIETYVALEGLVDIKKETSRLKSSLSDVEKFLKNTAAKLKNSNFVSRAPKDVVEKEKQKYHELEERKTRLQENLSSLIS